MSPYKRLQFFYFIELDGIYKICVHYTNLSFWVVPELNNFNYIFS